MDEIEKTPDRFRRPDAFRHPIKKTPDPFNRPPRSFAMDMRPNRRAERAAVNAARTFFESCNCVFQAVDLANDFGKDAYVDLVEGNVVTGLCVAVQIKGGRSYRRAEGYAIPLDEKHAQIWRASSVPVAGLVHDPADNQLRWCNISEFLRRPHKTLPSCMPVPAENILTPQSLESDFKPSFRTFESMRSAGLPLLQLTSDDESLRVSALLDCFGLGRSDPRVLILLRHLLRMFGDEQLRLAILILAHTTPHPDVFWHKGNWIPQSVCDAVTRHLLWSEDEIGWLLGSISQDDMQRSAYGQDVYCLLRQDPTIEKKMGEVAHRALLDGNEDVAWYAMYLTIYWAGKEGLEMYRGFLAIDPDFRRLPLAAELEGILNEQGRVTLFE